MNNNMRNIITDYKLHNSVSVGLESIGIERLTSLQEQVLHKIIRDSDISIQVQIYCYSWRNWIREDFCIRNTNTEQYVRISVS